MRHGALTFSTALLFATTGATLGPPVASQAQEVGPPNGSLVIVGGGMRDPAIVERFMQLAGGPDAPIVVIPTAGGAENYDEAFGGLRPFHEYGVHNLTLLHTTDPAVADTDEFVEPIRSARGVWFSGGRQWRLADAYIGTKTEQALWDLLERGGVIGGSSAGATIQGSYLARGDTRTNEIMMGDHEEGFAFLKNTAIDQHLLRRNRQFDLIEIVEARPELLGIGIDENTAIASILRNGNPRGPLSSSNRWVASRPDPGPSRPDPGRVGRPWPSGSAYGTSSGSLLRRTNSPSRMLVTRITPLSKNG